MLNKEERKAFGNGILWAVITILISLAILNQMDQDPNPGLLVGTALCGLWFRFGRPL